ncbi:uncharacterized protein LOC107616425 [Arachis ipaensis]|uniref:uncharacterized protein LOC107616425 n=1 Tax=Arachis ipaensis TaxID=130454 RepID=UPI0007AF3C55|nr:uncharacterized protein LOC107616425 [Arachis ipaensis]
MSILQKAGLCGAKWVKKVFYKIPIVIVSSGVQYEIFVIGLDEDMQISGVDDGGGTSTLIPVVAPCCLLAAPPSVPPPTARSLSLITGLFGDGEPDHVEKVMPEDDSDNEPDHILEDSEEDTPGGGGTSTSGAIQLWVAPTTATFLRIELGSSGPTKEEAVLSVKDYSIRRGVQYRVMESDHLKYHERCKEFGNGCTWMIGITRRPSYRKVWMAKQKAVADLRGLERVVCRVASRWILGVQATMEGTVALLKTSPVSVGDQVNESTEYFHHFFWTFPLCIEAFRHCKPLVSIDGTHLYGKYGRTLLLAIVQDGNSNILPVAFALVEGENAESWAFFLS